jgi:prolipoprotein diacylglyceryl transferase
VTSTILASIPSPSQGVWHLWIFPIRAYALCIVAGIIAALIIGDRRWAARGGERGVIYDIALWAVPFGLVGGRLYHVMTDWSTYFSEGGAGIAGALRIWDGGLGIWGAVALGGVGAWLGCRQRGIPLPAFGDAIAPGIILAQAIGRLGNYFNQELYGRETDMPWGLIIYDRENAAGQRDMLNGVSTGVPLFEHPVHPTFLYELLWNLLVFAVLLWADKRFKLGHGRLFALYVAGYCLGRFWVELMRSDYATLIAGIRVNTFTSTFVFIGAVIYIMAAKKGREDPESLRGKDADREEVTARVEDSSDSGVTVAAAAGAATAVAVAASGTTSSDEGAESTEPTSEVAAEAEDLAKAIEETPDEELAEADEFAQAVADAPAESEGLGAVEGDEVAEAQTDAPEVHEAAVAAAEDAEATADEVAEEPESEEPESEEPEESEPEAEEPAADEPASEGLGAVEGDEVVEAQAEAPDVHEAAVEAAADAETTADEVAEEPESEEADIADESEPEAEEPDADEPASEGLGAVEGDEVAEAQAEAPDVHEAAVEAAADADATADEVAEEPESEEADDADESEPETEEPEAEEPAADEPASEGLGAVEGDEVVEAQADAPEVHEAAVEAAADAETTVAEEPEAQPEAQADAPAAATPDEPRKRWWRRNS